MGTRVFADGQVGNFEETGMSYPDFIFFMLSEEDKSSVCALRYWYVCTSFVCCLYFPVVLRFFSHYLELLLWGD